jgi:hypothetical protein
MKDTFIHEFFNFIPGFLDGGGGNTAIKLTQGPPLFIPLYASWLGTFVEETSIVQWKNKSDSENSLLKLASQVKLGGTMPAL